MTYYLDLDRTLYRTDEGVAGIWQLIETTYGLHAHQVAVQQEFFVYIEDLYYYDFDAHLKSLGLDVDAVYRMLASSELADGCLEHPGVRELVESLSEQGEVKVLTFGERHYQQLKASLCPSLKGIDLISTLRPKAEYFAAHPAKCWLVDDRALGDSLPGHVNFVQVSLEGKPVPDDASWPICYSLDAVRRILI